MMLHQLMHADCLAGMASDSDPSDAASGPHSSLVVVDGSNKPPYQKNTPSSRKPDSNARKEAVKLLLAHPGALMFDGQDFGPLERRQWT